MKAVELFCGMGISSTGLVRAGIELVAAYDLNTKVIHAFNSQSILPPVGVSADVMNADVPKCDLISAGPVCKAFSPGATLFGTKGGDDGRNTFPHLMRVVRDVEPRNVLVENSYGLARFRGYLEEIITSFVGMGYEVDWHEIDCYDYGVPQHRRRLVILASKDGRWPCTKPKVRVGPTTVGECLGEPPDSDPWPVTEKMSVGSMAYMTRDPRHLAKHPPLRMNKPASTVVGNYRRGVPYGVVDVNGELRMCGSRLAARLQGLPDEYNLSMMSKTAALEAIGNGFPGQVTEHLISVFMGTSNGIEVDEGIK
jgi:DNA (cytosine-5)-methyltransferase 1